MFTIHSKCSKKINVLYNLEAVPREPALTDTSDPNRYERQVQQLNYLSAFQAGSQRVARVRAIETKTLAADLSAADELLAKFPVAEPRVAVGKMDDLPIPDATDNLSKTYTVAAGDTLGEIARDNKTTLAALLQRNPGINPNLIKPGQVINISGEAPAATAQASAAPAPRVSTAPAARPATMARSPDPRPRGEGEVKSYATQLEEAKKNLATALAAIAQPNVTNKEPYDQMKRIAETQIKALEPLAKQELAVKDAQEKYAKLSPAGKAVRDLDVALKELLKKEVMATGENRQAIRREANAVFSSKLVAQQVVGLEDQIASLNKEQPPARRGGVGVAEWTKERDSNVDKLQGQKDNLMAKLQGQEITKYAGRSLHQKTA